MFAIFAMLAMFAMSFAIRNVLLCSPPIAAPFSKSQGEKESCKASSHRSPFFVVLVFVVVLIDSSAILHAERALRLSLSFSLMNKSFSTDGSSFFDCNGAAPVVAVEANFA